MKTVTDEWNHDGRTFTRTYTEEEIMWELNDIWSSEEYRNDEYSAHIRAEHLEELLKELK